MIIEGRQTGGKIQDFVATVNPDGLIRIDDRNQLDFWIQITLTDEELRILSQKTEESS